MVKTFPVVHNHLLKQYLGRSQLRCCFPTFDQSRMSLTGCFWTVTDNRFELIFCLERLTVDHKLGSSVVLCQARHTLEHLTTSYNYLRISQDTYFISYVLTTHDATIFNLRVRYRRKDKNLKITFYDGNQVYDKG